ncbi:MAG: hypothetical protein IJ282_02730 [Lachnospiraceae bacterium]|nr:hypothetical protein [Lachnospiraceae bacterium]
MKKYKNNEENLELLEVHCNKCGRNMRVENGILKEGCFHGDFAFGYFSERDGVRHRFELCEKCYNEVISGFVIPVEETQEQELL